MCVTASPNSDSIVPESEKLCLEGKIVQKLECRPYGNYLYRFLRLLSRVASHDCCFPIDIINVTVL